MQGDGIRDKLLRGNPPDAVLVIDVSGSVSAFFDGTPVGDINGDGYVNTILDAELAGFIALNNGLIAQGLGEQAQVGIVVFGRYSAPVNMDTGTSGFQLVTNPNSDRNYNGVSDLEDILRTIGVGALGIGSSATNYEAGLQSAMATIGSVSSSK